MATKEYARARRLEQKALAREVAHNTLIAMGKKGDKQAERAAASMALKMRAGMEPEAAGPPPIAIDEQLVEGLATIHCTSEEIATIVGVNKSTLERNCAALLEKGRAQGKSSLKRQQFKSAMAGNATMLIWLGKNYLNQTDKVATEITGANGGPIQTVDARIILTAKIKDIASRRASSTATAVARISDEVEE